MRTAAKVSVVSRCVRGIDERGLHKTNLAALRDALLAVARPGCICLSDGFPVGELDGHQRRAVVNGDATSAAIAAASIVAKVTRDRYMHRADAEHPGWEFAAHVGYSTPEHRDAIQRLGVSPLHRLSFQSTAYQQLALAGFIRTPPPGVRGARVARAPSTVTPTASKRSSVAGAGRSPRHSQAAAMRRTWRCLADETRSDGVPAPAAVRRVLTSTNTSVASVVRDQVELAEAGAVVAGDQPVAEALEMLEREPLAGAAQVLAQVGGGMAATLGAPACRISACLCRLRRGSVTDCAEVRGSPGPRDLLAGSGDRARACHTRVVIRRTRSLASPVVLARVDHLRHRRPDLPPRGGRGRPAPRPARVHDRGARRRRGPRVARARPRRAAELGVRVPGAEDHRQPRAGEPAQDRPGLRPRDRVRGARGLRAGAARQRSTAGRSSASCRSAASCATAAARSRWPRAPAARASRA